MPTTLLPWLSSLFTDAQATSSLAAIAGVSVVAWTAGFIVKQFGHRPSMLLIEAMNFAQLAFMGALAAMFLTPPGLRVAALLFLVIGLLYTYKVIRARATPQAT